MAAMALIEGSSPADDRLLAKARRTVDAVRAQAPRLVAGHPDCSHRLTAGEAAAAEALIVGVLVEVQRLADRLDALERR